MKLLILAMNAPEAAATASQLSAVLQECGCTVTVCDYWLVRGYSPDALIPGPTETRLTLSDGGFESAPRLSHAAYTRLCGNDVDFAAVSTMVYSAASYPQQYPLSRRLLDLESDFHQALRGLAFRIEHILLATRPDLLLIQQGGEAVSRVAAAKAAKHKIPWLTWETPFFPGYFLLDPLGQHFFPCANLIDQEWTEVKRAPLTPDLVAQTSAYIDHWKQQRISKYAQASDCNKDVELNAWLNESDGPLLFVPMQVPVDANVHYGLGAFKSLHSFYLEIVKSLPEGWRAVFKKHPKDDSELSQDLEHINTRSVQVVRAGDIHDLIQRATTVATFSSNVGLEALLYDKPVVVGGNPCYARKGLTIELSGAHEITKAIQASRSWRPSRDSILKLTNYLVRRYLVRVDDHDALRRRIEQAVNTPARRLKTPQAPFAEYDPPSARAYAVKAGRISALLRSGYSFTEALDLDSTGAEPPQQILDADDQALRAYYRKIEASRVTQAAWLAFSLPVASRVLHVSPDHGATTFLMAARSKCRFIDAIGAEKDAVHYARRNWRHRKISYQQISLLRFHERSPTNTYDAVVCQGLPDRVANVRLTIDLLWNRIRPGGILLLCRSSASWQRYGAPGVVDPTSHDDLADYLAQLPGCAGFDTYFQDASGVTVTPAEDSDCILYRVRKSGQNRGQPRLPGLLSNEMARKRLKLHILDNFVMSLLTRRRSVLASVLMRGLPSKRKLDLA